MTKKKEKSKELMSAAAFIFPDDQDSTSHNNTRIKELTVESFIRKLAAADPEMDYRSAAFTLSLAIISVLLWWPVKRKSNPYLGETFTFPFFSFSGIRTHKIINDHVRIMPRKEKR